MTQPTDPRGSNGPEAKPAAKATPEDPTRKSAGQRDTILLSEVPDSQTMLAEPADWGTGGQATQAQTTASPALPPNVHLSTAAIAALGQRYDILSDAGHGSMGNVFKARDRETGEVVALKLLKPEIASDQAMMDRFKNELLFARKITHKNVCRVYDFNRINGLAYTSMEFVEGESLRSVLNRFGGLPLRKGIDLARQICSGLKEAHAQGIVHRDLKPENVMVDERGNVKIMDFGIARSMDALTRMTGAMVGTPAYMAPEQVGGKAVDYRTDIYSLGLILYEMFTGVQAFHADNAVAVAMKQLNEVPVPPHEVDPAIPAPIERVILKCLEKDPAKRFQSVEELEKALLPAGAQSGGPAIASTTAGRSTQEALGQYATPLPAPRVHSMPPPPKSSSRKGVVLALVLLFAFVAAAGVGRWARLSKFVNQLPPPAEQSVPAPPDFALKTAAPTAASATAPASAAPATGSAEPAQDASSSTPPAPAGQQVASGQAASATPSAQQPAATTATAPAAVPAPAATTSASLPAPTATPAKNPPAGANAANSSTLANAAPTDVQQRADAAFKEQSAATANPGAQQNPPRGSVLRGKGPSYIWVGRYEREDRAQDASRKIQGLGLPAVVVPRHIAQGQFYVVFTGPVSPEKIPSEIDWLKTQGFANVREVKALGVGQNGGPEDSVPDQSGATP
jgi:serine/threonine protein kinase